MTTRNSQRRQTARAADASGATRWQFFCVRAWRPGDRRALLLMTVLVCLGVVMTLAAAWLKTIVLEHRHVRAAADGVQAEFLSLSGLDRAAARLAADPNYSGETWQLEAGTLHAQAGATVAIHVGEVPNQPGKRRVTVVAEFPDDGPHRARRTQESTIALPIRGEAS